MSSRRIIGAWGIVLGSFLAVGAVLALTSCTLADWDQGGGKWPWPPPPKGGTPPGPPVPPPSPPAPSPPAPVPPGSSTKTPPILAGALKKLPKMPLQVTECTLGTAPFVPPLPPQTLAFRFGFSDAVDPSTVKLDEAVHIFMNGEFQGGGKYCPFPANSTFYISPDRQTAVLVSGVDNREILRRLGAPPGGKVIAFKSVSFDVLLAGTLWSVSGVIKDAAGRALDGDGNGQPGGNYHTVLKATLHW